MPHYDREITCALEGGASPRIDVRNVNGSIRVRGEDRADVLVVARAHFRAEDDAAAESLMREIQDGIHSDGDRVVANSPEHGQDSLFGVLRHLGGQRTRLELDFDIAAPRGCSLALHLVSGTLDVARVTGDTRVQMVNGRFEVSDIGGDLSMHHVNGRGAIRGVAGSIGMHYTNGALEIDRAGGDVDLHLVNGRVEVRDAGAAVSVRSVSGSFELTGPIRGDVKVSNSHGRIVLNVPRDSRFELDAHSSIGKVSSELDVRDGGRTQGDAPLVSLRSETGAIELRRLREAEPAAAGRPFESN